MQASETAQFSIDVVKLTVGRNNKTSNKNWTSMRLEFGESRTSFVISTVLALALALGSEEEVAILKVSNARITRVKVLLDEQNNQYIYIIYDRLPEILRGMFGNYRSPGSRCIECLVGESWRDRLEELSAKISGILTDKVTLVMGVGRRVKSPLLEWQRIVDLVNEIGTQWRRISKEFSSMTPGQIRQQWHRYECRGIISKEGRVWKLDEDKFRSNGDVRRRGEVTSVEVENEAGDCRGDIETREVSMISTGTAASHIDSEIVGVSMGVSTAESIFSDSEITQSS